MNYQYVAYTSDWKIVKGTINTASEVTAEQLLTKQGYQPITLRPMASMPAIEQMFPSLFKIKPGDIVMFSRQLATLIEAGISVVPALQMIQEQMSNKLFRNVISSVLNDLRAGSHFSDALNKHSNIFGELYCQLVSVGEQTGSLETSLRQAANHIEKESAAKKKVKRAMTYPTIVLVVAIVVVAVMVMFVLPSMMTIFTSLGAELPLPTKILIGIVNFATDYKLHILAGMVLLVIIGAVSFRQPAARYQLDRLMLKIPVIGPVIRMNEMSRFSRTIALLFHAGLPLPTIMDMARQTSSNRVMQDALAKVQQELVQGQGLSEPMSKNSLFPRLLVQMVMVGEETGSLESTLNIVADSYESEADSKLGGLIALIEPVMTIALAVMVAFIALSVISPMYSVLGSFEQ